MIVQGTTQTWDLDGDGVVDISDLTLAIAELRKALDRVEGITKYIQDADPSVMPPPVKATVNITIG